MGELRQYGNLVHSKENPLSHFKRLQIGIFGFSEKETGTKSRCHSVSFVMYICGAKFEENYSNISGDILDSSLSIKQQLFFTS